MARVFLGLGSNLGPREATLAQARVALESAGVTCRRQSSIYETEPVGGPPQPWFLNAVLEGETALAPEGVLAVCLQAEAGLGRVRGERDAARSLDVDVLFYDDLRQETPDPVLPHPRLHERRFVLVPLVEIAPGLIHPSLGLSVAELLLRCPDRSAVRLHPGALGSSS